MQQTFWVTRLATFCPHVVPRKQQKQHFEKQGDSGSSVKIHENQVSEQTTSSYRRLFYSETDFDVLDRFPTSYRNFEARRNFYTPRTMSDSDFQMSKNSNFQNGLKFDLNKFRC